MPAPIATSLATILPVMQQRIMDYTELPRNRVLVCAFNSVDEVPHFTAEHDVLIRLMDEAREPDALEGSGRADDRRNRRVEIYCRARSYQDKAGQDQRKLIDPMQGLIILEDKVADALQVIMLEDKDHNILNIPIYLEGPTSPQKDRDDKSWCHSHFTAIVQYVRNLNLLIQ